MLHEICFFALQTMYSKIFWNHFKNRTVNKCQYGTLAFSNQYTPSPTYPVKEICKLFLIHHLVSVNVEKMTIFLLPAIEIKILFLPSIHFSMALFDDKMLSF